MADPAQQSLAEFLAPHPWPAEHQPDGAPVELFLTFDLDASSEALWPYLIDTSTFNRRLGMGEMVFTEKGGRRYGSAVNAGFKQVWEEIPWQWEYARSLSNARVYSEGFARYVRARYQLEELAPGRTRLTLYFGWIPRNLLGRTALILGTRFLRTQITRVVGEIVQAIGAHRPLPGPPPPPPLPEEAQRRLAQIGAELVEARQPAALVQRVLEHVTVTPDDELSRIRVRVLARAWGVKEGELLKVFLHGTRRGLFTFTWDIVCPHCRGVRAELEHLGEVLPEGACEVCGITFDATQMNVLEVTFHVHPGVRKVERHAFCAAEPARKPHIFVQRTVAPKETLQIDSLLGAGGYRLRVQGRTDFDLLDVNESAGEAGLSWQGGAAGKNHRVRPRPALLLTNPGEQPATFVVEQSTFEDGALRPSELFVFQEFRDLFSEEAVASDIQLDIGTRVILFTDLVGSTRFYEEKGDSVAFAEVRRHFIKAYETVLRNEGAIIKTIGDAVMAVFSTPASAMRAAVELQRQFNGGQDSPLRLRITVHAGPCLAVRLNSNIDLFGSAVNLTAKLQSTAEAGQITFTEEVAKDEGVKALLKESGLGVEPVEFCLKWSGRVINVNRIEVG